MIGVTVAIGMLVDDAIVVVESIQQKREEGYAPMEAALRGTAEIALAVVLSTLTTVVAFIPIMFLSGDRRDAVLPLRDRPAALLRRPRRASSSRSCSSRSGPSSATGGQTRARRSPADRAPPAFRP